MMRIQASAAIAVGTGSPTHTQGWPEGASAVANLKSCLGWWEGPPFGGGETHVLFRGDTEAFIQALTNFAAIRAPVLDLVIHEGPKHFHFLKRLDKQDADTRVDWELVVWDSENWHRLYNNPKVIFDGDNPNFRQPVAAPRLEVFLGGGSIDWSKIKIPTTLRVRDERASAMDEDLKNKAAFSADIYDMATAKPVRSARLTVRRWSATTTNYQDVAKAEGDNIGHIEIPKLESGRGQATIEAEGYATRVMGNINLDGHTKSLVVELAKQSSLRGIVTDMDGKPIQGARIQTVNILGLNGRGYSLPRRPEAKTDNEGQFELAGLPRGYLQLFVNASGYYFTELAGIREVPATNEILRLARAGSIHVSVTDKSGHPLSRYGGQEVMVMAEPKDGEKIGSPNGSAKVNDDGVVDFFDRPPGEYHLTSRPNPSIGWINYTPEQFITVKPGETANAKMVYD